MELLERASFLATLAEYADEARHGDGRLILVSGESGIGKTALVEAFQRDITGTRWLWGACDGLFTPRPLGPLFDIAAQLDGELAELCRREAPRNQLFQALLAELGSAGGLTIAVIEDAHWADEATIDLISYVGRRLGRIPAMVLVTFRDDEVGEDHPLRRAIGDLATQRATRRMTVPPLSAEAVQAFVGQRDIDAARLYQVTGGNPFFVSEILETGWPSMPETVRDAVGARLARLSMDARQAVEAASVIGLHVDRSLLSVVADAEQVDAGLAAGLLISDNGGLRFRHELLRMAVEAGIAGHRKAGLHARLLAELERAGGSDPAVLAYHAAGARDQRALLRHAPVAAERAAALGAHREAAAHYERALGCTQVLTPRDAARLHESAAAEYALLDRWADVDTSLRAALVIRGDLGDDLSVGKDLSELSTALWRLCRGEESERAAADAVAVLEPLPPGAELAWAYAKTGAMAAMSGRLTDSEAYIDKAEELGKRLGQADVVSYALNAHGLTRSETGKDGIPLLERGLQIAIDADIHVTAGLIYTSLQEAANMQDRYDVADRYYADGIAYCDEHELGVYATCLRGGRAWGLLLRGRWDEAVALTTYSLGQPRISPVNRLNPLRVQGAIRARRGDELGWQLLDDAISLAISLAEPSWIVPIRTARAELRWLQGQRQLAVREAEAGRTHLDLDLDMSARWPLVVWLVRLDIAADLSVEAPEPYALELAGDWRAAAAAWERLQRPYDAALVRLVHGDEAGLRQSLAAFDELGAKAAAAAVRRRMRETGVQAIPRGPRAVTRSAPAGLTPREREVLALLTLGMPDKEISRELVISERTVQHHVSAVLAKIGVSSRTAAIREAARLGIGASI